MTRPLTLTERVLGTSAQAPHERQYKGGKKRGPKTEPSPSNHIAGWTVPLSAITAPEPSTTASESALPTTITRKSKNGLHKIYSGLKPPERSTGGSGRGYPWHEMAVGECFFVHAPRFKVQRFANKKFITTACFKHPETGEPVEWTMVIRVV